MLTLQELLASILLEESLVLNRSVQVVDHQLEDGKDLLLSITSILGKSRIPWTTVEDVASEIHGGSGDVRWRILEESVIQAANLEKVFAEGTGLDVVVVCFGNATEEVHRVGV